MSTLTGHSPDSDTALLERFAVTGAEAAFRGLVDRHAAMVLALARRNTGEEESAREVTQRVFILLARKAPRLLGHPSIAGWLFTVCRMECRTLRRESARRARLMRDFASHQAATVPGYDAGDGPSGVADKRTVFDFEGDYNGYASSPLDEALGQLTETDRQVLLSRYGEGSSFADIARSRQVSEAAARKQVSRALERLSALLGRCQEKGRHRSAEAAGLPAREGRIGGEEIRAHSITAATLVPLLARLYPHPASPLSDGEGGLPQGMTEGLTEHALRSAATATGAAGAGAAGLAGLLTFPALTAFMTAKGTLAITAAVLWIASIAAGWQAGVRSGETKTTGLSDDDGRAADQGTGKPRAALKSRALPPGQSGPAPASPPRQAALRDLLARIAADFESAEWDKVAGIRGQTRLKALADTDAAEALTVVAGMRNPPIRLVTALWQRRAQAEGQQAVEAALKLPANSDNISIQRSALLGWGNKDPAGALDWALHQPAGGLRHMGLQSIFTSWTAKEPSTAFDSAMALTDPAERAATLTLWGREAVAPERREDFMNAILSLPETSRGELLASAANQWRESPAKYAAWLEDHQSLTAYGIWPASSLSAIWAETDPAAAATWLRQAAGTLPKFPEALSTIIEEWALQDAPAATEWLAAQPPGPAMDPSIEVLIRVLSPTENEAVKAWSARLHDQKQADAILKARGLSNGN